MAGEPGKASSVWPLMPFMRGQKAATRLRDLMPQLAAAHARAAARRERVLRHEWARKRLCSICGYKRAEQWNGHVPPARTPDGALNTSPVRRALVELLREVAEYEQHSAEDESA